MRKLFYKGIKQRRYNRQLNINHSPQISSFPSSHFLTRSVVTDLGLSIGSQEPCPSKDLQGHPVTGSPQTKRVKFILDHSIDALIKRRYVHLHSAMGFLFFPVDCRIGGTVS
jgi:hypothetical protein